MSTGTRKCLECGAVTGHTARCSFAAPAGSAACAKLPAEQKDQFKQVMAGAKGKTTYEKLQNIEGFDGIKHRLEAIRHWETILSKELTDGTQAEFTDDFYHLFNFCFRNWTIL